MRPSFNTTGPCVPGEHYMLPPGERLGRVLQLIDRGKYFTLHAGRQTGKTTCARWLVDHLNGEGRFSAIWVDLETVGTQDDLGSAFKTVLNTQDWAVGRDLRGLVAPPVQGTLLTDPSTAVLTYLRELSARCPRPLVILFDEADRLVGQVMVSFLTQLRAGYNDRSSTPFPHSIALVGMRQVRDYVLSEDERVHVRWLGTASPFNVSAEAATLSLFSGEQVASLLQQHTDATGQRFEPEAVERIQYLSQGHPWLVNAIADQIVDRDVEDRRVAITAEHVEAAKETIILERRSHIDSLVARLREPRVRRILDPMLAGTRVPDDVLDDDFSYVIGLGLIRFHGGRFEIANPIYAEVIPRALTFTQQTQVTNEPANYVCHDSSLDMPKCEAHPPGGLLRLLRGAPR